MKSALLLTTLALALASTTGAQHTPLQALSVPCFVEGDKGRWSAFPAPGAPLVVRDTGFLLRDMQRGRTLELELPSEWRLRPIELLDGNWRVIDAAGVRTLRGAAALEFEAADLAASLELRFLGRDALELTWRGDAFGGARLRARTANDRGEALDELESALTAPTTSPVRWVRQGQDTYRPARATGSDSVPPELVQQLVFGAFLGGSNGDEVRDMALSSEGKLVVAGGTWSPDFPIQPGAFDPDPDVSIENTDAFVAGLSADGSSLEFATFLGGSDLDSAEAVGFGPDGHVFLAGGTRSTDFPATPGAFDASYNGGAFDGFVARLTHDGSALLGASYIGTANPGQEFLANVTVDPLDGSVIVSGSAGAGWPTTPGALAETWLGSGSSFLTRFAPDLESVIASTYFLKGAGGRVGLLPDGSLVQGGFAANPANLSMTQVGTGAFAHAEAPRGSTGAGWLGCLSADFTSMVWSTWTEASLRVEPRADGSIVLIGTTREDDFPTSPGAYSSRFTGTPGVDPELVACAISGDGQQMLWATYITSESLLAGPVDSALDSEGRIYFVSAYSGGSYPFSDDAWDTELVGFTEGLLTVLAAEGTELLYASLLGVGHGSQELNFDLAVDGCGGAYISGDTFNPAFPTTPGSLGETYNGGGDAYLLRVTAVSPWENLGGWIGGINGRPLLEPSGPLCAGDPTALRVSRGPPSGTAFLVLGLSALAAPFKGGVMIPAPDLVRSVPLDAEGASVLGFEWPAGSPSRLQLWLQGWLPDLAGPAGYSATNAVVATVP